MAQVFLKQFTIDSEYTMDTYENYSFLFRRLSNFAVDKVKRARSARDCTCGQNSGCFPFLPCSPFHCNKGEASGHEALDFVELGSIFNRFISTDSLFIMKWQKNYTKLYRSFKTKSNMLNANLRIPNLMKVSGQSVLNTLSSWGVLCVLGTHKAMAACVLHFWQGHPFWAV